MNDQLTETVAVWATQTAGCMLQFGSTQARNSYLDERHRELVAGGLAEGLKQPDAEMLADACLQAARRIMAELLQARGAGASH